MICDRGRNSSTIYTKGRVLLTMRSPDHPFLCTRLSSGSQPEKSFLQASLQLLLLGMSRARSTHCLLSYFLPRRYANAKEVINVVPFYPAHGTPNTLIMCK